MNDTARRYSLAILSHVLLILAWYLFVEIGKVPKFVMPSPQATFGALFTGNYRWFDNIFVTGVEIFGGYILAVLVGVGLALSFSWSRTWENAMMPLLSSASKK